MSNTISTAASVGKFIDQLLLKVISLQVAGKRYKPSDSLKKQILAWHIAVEEKKMNNKHSQVLLVVRKNPRK